MRDENQNNMENTCRYELIWVICGSTCLIGIIRPGFEVKTRQIKTHIYHIRQGELTRTQHSLKFHFLIISSPISSSLSLSHPQSCHLLRTWCWVIPLHLWMPRLWLNTKYCINQVLHTPRTAYTRKCIIPRSTVSRSQPVSHLTVEHVMLNPVHSLYYEVTNEYSLSSCRASIPNYHQLISCLQVLVKFGLVMASKCISKLASSLPPSSHTHRLLVHL